MSRQRSGGGFPALATAKASAGLGASSGGDSVERGLADLYRQILGVDSVGPRDDFAVLGVVCGVFRPFFEQEPAPPAADDATLA